MREAGKVVTEGEGREWATRKSSMIMWVCTVLFPGQEGAGQNQIKNIK